MFSQQISQGGLFVLLACLAAATVTDLRTHRIPNVLTASGVALALLIEGMPAGAAGIGQVLTGLAVGLLILLPFYAARAMGAGDVKLMAMTGAFIGPGLALLAGGMTLLVGAVIALAILVLRGGFRELVRRYLCMTWSSLTMGRLSYMPPQPGTVAASRFPYAVAIGTGTVFALMWTARIRLPVTGMLQ